MNEQVLNLAMEIILHAGDARNYAMDAMSAHMSGEPSKAKELLHKAKESVKKAHLVQTETIQNEARGNKIDICLLFIHAQDTLMTISSEVNMIEQMIKMYNNLEDKINGYSK